MAFNFNAVIGVADSIGGIVADINKGFNLVGNLLTFSSAGRSVGVSKTVPGGLPITGKLPSTTYMSKYVSAYSNNPAVKYTYRKLFSDFSPDISGYTLIFMVPPPLSGFSSTLGNTNYEQFGSGFTGELGRLVPLLATNYVPPSIQMNSAVLSGPSGSQHYPTNISITENMSVTYIDTINLDVYAYHASWLDYIYQITEGTLDPSDSYVSSRMIDYMGAFYIVKWQPDMETIQYIGKAVGCMPKELPTSEVVGSRAANELTNITFNYTVSNYFETTINQVDHWLFSEFQNIIMSQYQSIMEK